LNQEYLASLEKYQNLLTEKQAQIEKLEVLKINLEAKLQLLLEKSQHSFLFEFVFYCIYFGLGFTQQTNKS